MGDYARRAMPAVLYAIPASHPCAVVERALQLKAVPYRRVELIPVLHKVPLKLRFGSTTVPAVRFEDGTRRLGSRALVRELEARAPDPPLLPADPDLRARAERAEEWGDQVLQPLVRRVLWAAIRRVPQATESYTEGARLPVPRPVARLSAPLVARMAQASNGAGDIPVRADLRALPGHLDRIDAWLADGTLGGAVLHAGDLQVAASVRLLSTVGDVAGALGARPARALALRAFPDYPGAVPAGSLPAAWLPPDAA